MFCLLKEATIILLKLLHEKKKNYNHNGYNRVIIEQFKKEIIKVFIANKKVHLN